MVIGWTNGKKDTKGFLKIGDKSDKQGAVLFNNYSLGVVTNRDPWCINPSRAALKDNVESTINFFNSEVARWQDAKEGISQADRPAHDVAAFVTYDRSRISWSHYLKGKCKKGIIWSQAAGSMFSVCIARSVANGSFTAAE